MTRVYRAGQVLAEGGGFKALFDVLSSFFS